MFLKHLNPLNNIRVAQGVEIVNYFSVNFQNYRKTTIKLSEVFKSYARPLS